MKTKNDKVIIIRGKEYNSYRNFCKKHPQYNYNTIIKALNRKNHTINQILDNLDTSGSSLGFKFFKNGVGYTSLTDFCRKNPQYKYPNLRYLMDRYNMSDIEAIEHMDSGKRFTNTANKGNSIVIKYKGKVYKSHKEFCRLNPEYDMTHLKHLMRVCSITFEEAVKGYNHLRKFQIRGTRYTSLDDFFERNPQYNQEKVRNGAIKEGISMLKYLKKYK